MATPGRKKGTPKTGGRKKGTPNKITLTIKDAVLQTFQQLGEVTHMVEWAREHPSDFYRIAAKLIPQQIQADVTHKQEADELSSDELAHIAAAGRSRIARTKSKPTEPDSVH